MARALSLGRVPRMRRASVPLICLGLLIATVVTASPAAGAPILTVDTFEDTYDGSCADADCSLRDAIAAVDSGGTVRVPSGFYPLSLSGPGGPEAGDLDLVRPVTIVGTGETGSFLDASGLGDRVFDVGADAELRHLTLLGGSQVGRGGVIRATSGHDSSSVAPRSSAAARTTEEPSQWGPPPPHRSTAPGSPTTERPVAVAGSSSSGRRSSRDRRSRGTTLWAEAEPSWVHPSPSRSGTPPSRGTQPSAVEVSGRSATSDSPSRRSWRTAQRWAAECSSRRHRRARPRTACSRGTRPPTEERSASGRSSRRVATSPMREAAVSRLRVTSPVSIRRSGSSGRTADPLRPMLSRPAVLPWTEASGCHATDQRGAPRSDCDSGAYEFVLCLGRPVTIVGTPGPDDLSGGLERDVFLGLGGNDEFQGSVDVDRACGGKR